MRGLATGPILGDDHSLRCCSKLAGVEMSDLSDWNARVTSEIEALHAFIAAWFRGECERTDAAYRAGLLDRLAPDMVNIQPSGQTLSLDDLVEPIRAAYGVNPDFQIRISDVALRYIDQGSNLVMATYLEHQSGARNTVPSSNTRTSSVLFRVSEASGRLIWLHIHETAVR